MKNIYIVVKSILTGMLFLSGSVNAVGLTGKEPHAVVDEIGNRVSVDYVTYNEGLQAFGVVLTWMEDGREYEQCGFWTTDDEIEGDDIKEYSVRKGGKANGRVIETYFFLPQSLATIKEPYTSDFPPAKRRTLRREVDRGEGLMSYHKRRRSVSPEIQD